MTRGTRRTDGWRFRFAVLGALLAPLASPFVAAAQDAPPIVPVVSQEAVAVIEGQGEGEWAPIEPVAAPEGEWVDPAAADVEMLDPALTAPTSVDAALDPSLAAVDSAEAAALEGAVEPAAAAEPIPALAPSLAPPASVAGPSPSVIEDWAPPTTVYIPESGQSLDGLFLDMWRAWGGALSWGNPITPEFEENGRIVQYFGFGRFEWAPDDPNGEVVQFGDLGASMRPFMLRRSPSTESAAVDSAADAATAWIPLDRAPAADSETFRFVPETGHTLRDEMLAFWVQTGEASYLGNPISEPYEANGLTHQMFERGTVVQEPGGWPYVLPIGEVLATRYGLDRTPVDQGELPTYSEALWTPPAPEPVALERERERRVKVDPNGERRVLISLSQQYLWAYQGDAVLWEGYISTGTEKFATPPGSFQVLSKLESQTMEGVLGGEYYNVPDVPTVQYFTEGGHAIHGAYWHSNFGAVMSHGCVNLPMDLSEWLYSWTELGTPVSVVA